MTEPHLIDFEAGMEMLAGARRRRLALREAIDRLEDSLSSPAGREGWPAEASKQVAEVRSALDGHIREVEADGGLLVDVLENQPRLAPAVAVLREEHVAIADALDEVAGELVALTGRLDPEAVASIRRLGMEVIAAVIEHRQRGADLVFDAYSVDIGGW